MTMPSRLEHFAAKASISRVVLALVASFILHPPVDAGNKRVAITRDDVAGVWVGLTTDHVELIRLELALDGDGEVGYLFADEQPCILRLQTWSFNRGKVGIELGDPRRCGHGREFSAVVAGNLLELTIRGDDWKRRAWLKKEAPLVRRWEKLRAAMADTSSEQQ